MSWIRNRWRTFLGSFNISKVADEMFERLNAQYSQPKRYYHTFDGHIKSCLKEFDRARCHLEDMGYWDGVENWHWLALQGVIWTHDVIYDSRAKDNEARSANWAIEFFRDLKASDSFRNYFLPALDQTIRFTTYEREPKCWEELWMSDIDLSTLGQAPDVFDRYEKGIGQEYSWVPEAVFRQKRAEILRRFLDRARIYYGDYFHDRYEKQARQNLARSLARLAV